MTRNTVPHEAQTQPGKASAENGLVVLDGPDGVAVTMTPFAAAETAKSLMAAASQAEVEAAENDRDIAT